MLPGVGWECFTCVSIQKAASTTIASNSSFHQLRMKSDTRQGLRTWIDWDPGKLLCCGDASAYQAAVAHADL